MIDATTIFSVASAILVSLGGGAVIIFALSKWLGDVWAARIIETNRTELSQRSGDRIRKVEALMKHYERQIEEFYGPLFNMVHQVFVANTIESELLDAETDGHPAISNDEKREQVRGYFQENYYRPFHSGIITIMRSKLYLIEGPDVPKSFFLYLKHAAQEYDQKSLWKQYGIDSSFLAGEPWPENFYDDIKEGFLSAMKNYQKCLNGLRA